MPTTTKKFVTWGLLLIAGIIFVGIGILAFINPLSSYVKLTKFAGIALLLNGGLLLTIVIIGASSPRAKEPGRTRERNWMQTESVFHLFFGILFLLNPLLAFLGLPYFIGSWMFCVGVVKILASLSCRTFIKGWAFILLAGSLSTIFGCMLLFSSFARATSITLLIGTFGLIMGSLYIFDALRLRNRSETLDMLL